MPLWLPVVITALAGIVPSVLLYRSSTDTRNVAAAQADRTAQLEERKADREDLQAALEFWKQSFEAVSLDNKELRRELGDERTARTLLARRVAALEDFILRAGLRVPNGSGDAP